MALSYSLRPSPDGWEVTAPNGNPVARDLSLSDAESLAETLEPTDTAEEEERIEQERADAYDDAIRDLLNEYDPALPLRGIAPRRGEDWTLHRVRELTEVMRQKCAEENVHDTVGDLLNELGADCTGLPSGDVDAIRKEAAKRILDRFSR